MLELIHSKLPMILLLSQIILGSQIAFAHSLGNFNDPSKIEGVQGFMIVGHEMDIAYEAESAWIINLSDGSLVAKIPTGDRQIGITMTPDHRYAYVANERSNSVTVIDLIKKQNITNIGVGNYPHELIISPSGKEVYVANGADTFISIIDVSTNKVTEKIEINVRPLHFSLNSEGDIYAISPQDHEIVVLDHTTKQIIDSISLGEVRPSNIWFSQDGSLAYITAEWADSVYVLDTSSKEVAQIIPVGKGPTFITGSPDRQYLYVSNSGEDTISVIHLDSKKEDRVSVGNRPLHIDFSPNGRYAYIAVSDENYVAVIDTQDSHIINKFKVHYGPHGLHVIKPHSMVISPLEFFGAVAGIAIGAGFVGFHVKQSNNDRHKIITAVLVLSALVGAYLALIDWFMWLVAPSHGYFLIGIILANIAVIGLMKFNRNLGVLSAFIVGVITSFLMILDVYTYQSVGLTFNQMLEHLYLQWPFDALLVAQILVAVTSWIALKQRDVWKPLAVVNKQKKK